MEYVIQTAGLTKIFRDFWGHQRVIAVDRLDLDIVPHEVFGMLGPNGSGKSTTIKMLLGLLFPTRGQARVLGELPGDVKTNARIGYLPEESYLYPFLNARETLDFYGRLFGIPRPQRKVRIDSLLDMVGLASVARRPIGEYSKGMIRRIGLAQALINDPDVLILDEPTSGLDPIGTRQIKDLVCELGRRGKTVLMCSHLLADVEDVCDRICILYGGKIQAQGRVDELLAHRELTQIRTARLSDTTIEKIRQIIAQENPDVTFDVTTPRDRLEDYFLHIVSKAQQAQTETSGAKMGTGMSDFLTASTDEPRKEKQEDKASVILDSLVQAEKVQPQALLQKTKGLASTTPVAPDGGADYSAQSSINEDVLKKLQGREDKDGACDVSVGAESDTNGSDSVIDEAGVAGQPINEVLAQITQPKEQKLTVPVTPRDRDAGDITNGGVTGVNIVNAAGETGDINTKLLEKLVRGTGGDAAETEDIDDKAMGKDNINDGNQYPKNSNNYSSEERGG